MEKKKNGKLIALIIAIVVVVLGASAGVMFAFGVFKSDKAKAFELLKQAPQKISETSANEYMGAQDMTKAMFERGMDMSLKYSDMKVSGVEENQLADVLAKLQFDMGLQLDVKNQKGRINLGAGAEGSTISLQAYASLADKKVSLAAPELLANKVFTLESKEDTDNQQLQKIYDLMEQLSELKEDFDDYMEEQGDSLYEGITCEKIAQGYRLTIPKDVTNDVINSFSDFVQEQKACVEILEELCGAEKGSVDAALKEILPQLTAGTADFSFDVLGEKGKLTGLKANVKDKSGVDVTCNATFAEDGDKSSMNLSITVVNGGQTLAKVEMKRDSVEGDRCKDTVAYKVTGANEAVMMDTNSTIEIDKATNAFTMTGSSHAEDADSEVTAKGSIKNLEKGKCVTYQFDELKIKTESLLGTQEFSCAAEITESVLDGEIVAPKGEEIAINEELMQTFAEKYGQEATLSLFTTLSKWGINMNDLYSMSSPGDLNEMDDTDNVGL